MGRRGDETRRGIALPLAAFAEWQGGKLLLRAALGHPERTDAPLLHAQVEAGVANVEQARELGERAAARLREQGAAAYLRH